MQEVADTESRIPAAVMGGRQKLEEGVLAGLGHPRPLTLDSVEVQDGVEIGPGMPVVTAGADGRLPAGLVLGTIETATRGGVGEHWHITIDPVRSTDNVDPPAGDPVRGAVATAALSRAQHLALTQARR